MNSVTRDMSEFLRLNLLFALLLMDRMTTIQSLVYGAPIENCQSMYPQHDYYLPQWLEPPPYNLSASVILGASNSSIQYNGKYNETKLICRPILN
jgi:hypothetical protein